ncbi:MAG: RNA polymerase sigma factor [Proteobacteria bacterium]|nr:RNA polymerase sigma factor [Pseudomonadota bacterium]
MSRGQNFNVEEYFRLHAGLVYRRALILLGNASDAEDAVQDVFIRALANRGRFRAESRATTWLYRITTNYCLNQLRDSSRRLELLRERYGEQDELPGAPDPDDRIALRRLLAEAQPDQAAAAVYVFVDGMTRPQAAQALGVSLRTVGNLLTRFTRWAREVLSSEPTAWMPGFLEPLAAESQRHPIVPETRVTRVEHTGSGS